MKSDKPKPSRYDGSDFPKLWKAYSHLCDTPGATMKASADRNGVSDARLRSFVNRHGLWIPPHLESGQSTRCCASKRKGIYKRVACTREQVRYRGVDINCAQSPTLRRSVG